MTTTSAMEHYDYHGKAMLAPMVRTGTLPMRLMALEYGADLVYTPEVVDKGIVGAERVVNEDNGTIDYLQRGVSVFRTHPSEKDRLVFQIGTANAELALQAALTVAQDVSTIDLNCGCPKKFSVHGGMGAALMEEPEKLCGILRTLVQGSGLPVTCKIRIFEDRERTLKLVKMIADTGIRALAVHCRYRDERPRDPGHWDRFKEIVESVSIPVIANGDVMEYGHIEKIRQLSGVAGVMIARGAQSNVSVFRKEGRLPMMDVVKTYIRKAMETRNLHSNTKYVLMQMFVEDTKSPCYRPLCDAKNFRAVCRVFKMEEEYDQWLADQTAKGFPTDLDTVPRKTNPKPAADGPAPPPPPPPKRKLEQVEAAIVVPAATTGAISEATTEPAAKVLKTEHILGDGSPSSWQPTPADSPQAEGVECREGKKDDVVVLPGDGVEQDVAVVAQV